MAADQLHKFCQLDFPCAIGPVDGRYLVRGERSSDEAGESLGVVAIKTLGAERRPLLGRRGRSSRADDVGAEPEPVAISRVTVANADPFDGETQARAWLGGVRDRNVADAELGDALHLLNRLVRAHRLASGDPYEQDLSLKAAHRIRIGFGTGDEIAEGVWVEARAVPVGAARGGRRSRLDPGPVVAEMLSGRLYAPISDDLLLRARLDFDEGRTRQAALQLHAAAEALASDDDPPSGAEQWSQAAAKLSAHAKRSQLDDSQCEQLAQLLLEMQRAAKRRLHL